MQTFCDKTDYPNINEWLNATIGTICDKIGDTLIQITYSDTKVEREKYYKICQDYIKEIREVING